MLLRSLKAVSVRPCACALSASCFQPTLRLLSSASGNGGSTPPPYPGAAGDHYQTLGLPPSASLDDIKRAFREQALLYHPDVTHASGDAQEASLAKFKQLNEAYSVLGDAGECAVRSRGVAHAPPHSRQPSHLAPALFSTPSAPPHCRAAQAVRQGAQAQGAAQGWQQPAGAQ